MCDSIDNIRSALSVASVPMQEDDAVKICAQIKTVLKVEYAGYKRKYWLMKIESTEGLISLLYHPDNIFCLYGDIDLEIPEWFEKKYGQYKSDCPTYHKGYTSLFSEMSN
jgi:hypothetical protein